MNPNAVMGLGSKLNTSEIIDRFIKIEKRRLQPVEQRKEEKLQQVDAWAALQTSSKTQLIRWTEKIFGRLRRSLPASRIS
jgi:flagellar capping protein FliD